MKQLILITILLSFLLINLGGYVHNTGSSLACPDWPLCQGQVMPEMVDGVLIEHSHRLLASLVGFLTLLIALLNRKNSKTASISYVALAMVITQGILGGITVIYQLPPLVSTAHLGLSMVFMCTLIFLHHKLSHATKISRGSGITPYLLIALVLIFLQILLGAFLRHLGLGGICGAGYQNSILCSENLLPATGTQVLHVLHRFMGTLAGAAVIVPSVLIFKRAPSSAKLLPAITVLIIPTQILLGIMVIGTGFQPLITMLHLGGAALLLMVIWKAYLNQSELSTSN
jgi:heme A synthase